MQELQAYVDISGIDLAGLSSDCTYTLGKRRPLRSCRVYGHGCIVKCQGGCQGWVNRRVVVGTALSCFTDGTHTPVPEGDVEWRQLKTGFAHPEHMQVC